MITGRYCCNPGVEEGILGLNSPPLSFDILYPVVNNTGSGLGSGLPSVAANAYGSGRIVATSDYIGGACILALISGQPFNPVIVPSLKFAYNVIAWSSSWTHVRKDFRQSGSSIDTIGGTKLIKSWTLPALRLCPAAGDAAVMYKKLAFYSVRVHALCARYRSAGGPGRRRQPGRWHTGFESKSSF